MSENTLRFLGSPAFMERVVMASKALVEAMKIQTSVAYQDGTWRLSGLKLVVQKRMNGSAKLSVTLERPGLDPSWPTVEIDLIG